MAFKPVDIYFSYFSVDPAAFRKENRYLMWNTMPELGLGIIAGVVETSYINTDCASLFLFVFVLAYLSNFLI